MTKNIFPYTFILLLFVIGILNAQTLQDSSLFINDEKFIVDSIKISGNDKTEDFIILRELTFKPGDSVSTKQLKYNRDRVFSLNLFTKVEVYPFDQNDKTIINIDVNESWYIYPIPFIYRADKSVTTYSYGINFTYRNFRGRNDNLGLTVSLGYDPFFSLIYDNPGFFYEEGLGFTSGLSYLNANNKNSLAAHLYGEDFKNRFYSGFINFYKRLDQFNLISLTTSFDYIEPKVTKYLRGMTASGRNIDRTLAFGLGYFYDSRDLKQFAQMGVYAGAVLIHKGFGINGINYNLINVDYRQYEKVVGELSTRWRLAFRHSSGRLVPFYDYSYLGYNETVRGHTLEKREGNNFVISSFEISYPVIKDWDFSIKLPLLPQSLTSARIGVFFTAFADAGHAFNNDYRFKLHDFYAGYGGGITILFMPYNAIRFEYAFGQKGKGEFLIGSGFAF
jgi:outer membrane protein assembly factor BamA